MWGPAQSHGPLARRSWPSPVLTVARQLAPWFIGTISLTTARLASKENRCVGSCSPGISPIRHPVHRSPALRIRRRTIIFPGHQPAKVDIGRLLSQRFAANPMNAVANEERHRFRMVLSRGKGFTSTSSVALLSSSRGEGVLPKSRSVPACPP
jgi:hypothetical protein